MKKSPHKQTIIPQRESISPKRQGMMGYIPFRIILCGQMAKISAQQLVVTPIRGSLPTHVAFFPSAHDSPRTHLSQETRTYTSLIPKQRDQTSSSSTSPSNCISPSKRRIPPQARNNTTPILLDNISALKQEHTIISTHSTHSLIHPHHQQSLHHGTNLLSNSIQNSL